MTYEEAIQILENALSADDIQCVAREWTKEHGFDTIKDASDKELMAFALQSPDDTVPTQYSYRQHAWTKIQDAADGDAPFDKHEVLDFIRTLLPSKVYARALPVYACGVSNSSSFSIFVKEGRVRIPILHVYHVCGHGFTGNFTQNADTVSWADGLLNKLTNALNEYIKLSEDARVADSNINRLRHWMDNKDIAVITAFRDEIKDVHDPSKLFEGDEVGHKLKTDEKKLRNRILKEELRRYGYGVTSVSGVYTGADGADLSEDSFLVVNLNNGSDFKKNLFDLSEKFNQDSFLYKGKGDEEAVLIHTNDADNIYGKEELAGKFYENVIGDMMTRINNKGFAFLTEEAKSKYQNGASKTWKERKEYRTPRMTDSVIMDALDFVRHPTEMRTVLSKHARYVDSYKQLRDSGIPPIKRMTKDEGERWNLSDFPNFSATGSVRGMREKHYGNDALLVRCGGYIYNVSSKPEIYEVATL